MNNTNTIILAIIVTIMLTTTALLTMINFHMHQESHEMTKETNQRMEKLYDLIVEE